MLSDRNLRGYGLELLASVRWIANENPTARKDVELLVEEVRGWTRRKGRMFTEKHIRSAWETLRDKGWMAEPAHV
jgi:hypothetical protein